jgi:protein-L-isoaspartate(D-aspartate) O-methyltransferase
MTTFAAARQHMVDSQIRPNKVSNPAIVAALLRIPREDFLPERLHGIAYVDEDIPLGGGRYLTEPMVLARLLQEARPDPTDVALIVGAATGYSAAVLAEICSTVVALESDPALAELADQALDRLKIDNAAVVQAPLGGGCPGQGPFDLILFDGAVDEVPATFFEQLNDNGRLAAVLAPSGTGMGRATMYLKTDGQIGRRTIFDAAIHRLPGFDRKPGFVF